MSDRIPTLIPAREIENPLGDCAVYIMASRKNGTLYVGATSDLISRVYQHRNKLVPGFTSDHNVTQLVYFEQFADMENAIRREKRLKKWNRNWKIRLIEERNPHWTDLYLVVWSRRLMVYYIPHDGRMRYGTGTSRERPHDRGSASSDTA
jgi:putative endonuclease